MPTDGQTVSSKRDQAEPVATTAATAAIDQPTRKRLPRDRNALTRKLEVQTSAGPLVVYVTAGYYEDGRIGELFARGRIESTEGGVQACWVWLNPALDAWAKAVSVAIQYGADPEVVLRKEVGVHCGMTEGRARSEDGETHWSTSIWSLIAEWTLKHLTAEQKRRTP